MSCGRERGARMPFSSSGFKRASIDRRSCGRAPLIPCSQPGRSSLRLFVSQGGQPGRQWLPVLRQGSENTLSRARQDGAHARAWLALQSTDGLQPGRRLSEAPHHLFTEQ